MNIQKRQKKGGKRTTAAFGIMNKRATAEVPEAWKSIKGLLKIFEKFRRIKETRNPETQET